MLRTKILYLKFIRNLEKIDVREFVSNLSGFEQGKGFGFIDTQLVDDVTLSSVLIYRSVVHQKIFEPEQNVLTIHDQEIFYDVPFELDFKAGLLVSELGGRKLIKLLSTLGKISEFQVSFDDLYINIGEFIEELTAKNIVHNILGMTIANFKPDIGLSGRFVASVHNQEVVQDIITAYGLDVKSIDIELIFDDPIIWRLTSSGGIAIRAEEDEIYQFVNLFKELALRCNNA